LGKAADIRVNKSTFTLKGTKVLRKERKTDI